MLGHIYEELFRLGDKYHKEEEMEKLEIVREVEDLVHRAYARTENIECFDDTYEGRKKTDFEKLLPLIEDVKPYTDGEDHYFWWGSYRYPNAKKVVEAALKHRTVILRNYEELQDSNKKLKSKHNEDLRYIKELEKRYKALGGDLGCVKDSLGRS